MKKRFSMSATPPEEARVWRLKMPVDQIGYLNSIFEAYEEMCLFNTKDKKRGIVEITVMPAFIEDFKKILFAEMKNCGAHILEEDQPYASPSA
jgi:hypothetical protein